MNSLRIQKQTVAKMLLWCTVGFFIYIPFHPFITAWVGSITGVYAPIKIWKDVVVAMLAVILGVYSLLNSRLRGVVWRDSLNLLILAYALLHFGLFLVFRNFSEESSVAGLIFNLRFLALFISLRIILAIFPTLRTPMLQKVLKVLMIGAVVVGVLALLQMVFPAKGVYELFGYDGVNTISPTANIDNNPNHPRAFSTLRGPNELGSYLILPITLTAAFILTGRRRWYVWIGFMLFSAALVASFSRSALIGAVVALGVLSVIYLGVRLSKKMRLAGVVGLIGAVAILLWASITIPSIRLFVFHSSPQDPTLFEGSTEDHFRATVNGAADVATRPLGRGPGEAGPASFYQTDEQPRIPENYYVQIAQETGIIGVAVFISILTWIGARLYKQRENLISLGLFTGLVGLSVTSLFLHSWADDPTSYVWWGLAAVAMGYNERQQWKKSKDSSRSRTSSSS